MAERKRNAPDPHRKHTAIPGWRPPMSWLRPDVVLTQDEVRRFLVMSACEHDVLQCETPNCEVCYEFVTTWKSLYQALDADVRLAVEEALGYADVRAPAFPQRGW